LDAQLKRGVLEACVLASLLKEDSYGYKIIKDLSEHIEISESTLYPILKRLENSKYVKVDSLEHNGRLRKYYGITDGGKKRLDEFMEEWKMIMQVYAYIKGEMGYE